MTAAPSRPGTPATPNPVLLLVDDHPVVRHGLALLIKDHLGFDVMEAGGANEGLQKAEDPRVRIVLLDVRLNDGDGLAVLGTIKQRRPNLPVLMISTFAEPGDVRTAVDRGASGYVLKEATVGELRSAIETAVRGSGTYLHPGATAALIAAGKEESGPLDRLSERELAVLRHVAGGSTNEDIATALYVSEKTVKSHLTNVFRKLGVTNRTQAAALALREGIGPE